MCVYNMPKDHFWNKRSSKKEATLDGTKANGLTRNGDLTRDGGTSRGSHKVGKTSSSGTGIKHLFGWGPIRKKSGGADGKVPRSVSSSALSETRTLGFQRTSSNGVVEDSKTGIEFLMASDRRLDQRQRHSSDRALETKNSSQIYSLPADTIKREVGAGVDGSTNSNKSPSPLQSPANSHSVKPSQQDYTEPWSTVLDGTMGMKSRSTSSIHHAKTGSGKKKENISPVKDTSISPPSVSPVAVNDDVNNDDYEEPWDRYTGGMPPFRKKSKDKMHMAPGRISPKPPAKLPPELSKPLTVDTTKPLPPLPPIENENDGDAGEKVSVPAAVPKRSVSLKVPPSSVSDYSEPVDTKRMSDTTRISNATLPALDHCTSPGGSSSEELQSPSPPPLPVRHVSTPIVNTSLALDQQP